jgi:hypothetical protein
MRITIAHFAHLSEHVLERADAGPVDRRIAQEHA